MHPDDLREAVANIKMWQRGDQRAPHKPLLLLYSFHSIEEWLMRYHGQQIRKPQRLDYFSQNNYINWHVREVFRGLARYAK
jgi:predicted restriction endonuclease